MHPNEELVRRFYDARARGDREEIGRILAADVRWHEPAGAYGNLSNDLVGLDAVFAELFDVMERDYSSGMTVHDVLANDEHAVALVSWWAERGGDRIDGREVGVYHVRDGAVDEVWFLADGDYRAFFA